MILSLFYAFWSLRYSQVTKDHKYIYKYIKCGYFQIIYNRNEVSIGAVSFVEIPLEGSGLST